MGLEHRLCGRTKRQRDKIIIKPLRVGKINPWAEEDPERNREYQRQWYKENKSQERARQRNYKELKRDELRQMGRHEV